MVRALLLFDFLSSRFFFCPRVEPSFVSTLVYASCLTFSFVVILGTICPSSSPSPLLGLTLSSISNSVWSESECLYLRPVNHDMPLT